MILVIKGIIILLFVSIFVALGSALYFLVRGDDSTRIVKALTWRIGLSLFLFILLFVAFSFAWISPHGVGG